MSETSKERAAWLRETAGSIIRSAHNEAQFSDRGYRAEINRAQDRARALLMQADVLDPPCRAKSDAAVVSHPRVPPRNLEKAIRLIDQQFGKRPVEHQKAAP